MIFAQAYPRFQLCANRPDSHRRQSTRILCLGVNNETDPQRGNEVGLATSRFFDLHARRNHSRHGRNNGFADRSSTVTALRAERERIMRFAKFHSMAVSAIAALALVAVLAAFFQASQQTINRASVKQGLGQDRDEAKRKWRWLIEPLPFLELIELRNLDSDNWMTDLEIKLKNKSEKPIYYVDLIVCVPDLKSHDAIVTIHFELGNPDLWSKDEPLASASPGDKFLKPGEETVLKVKDEHKSFLRKIFEQAIPQRGDLTTSTSRLELYFHQIVFSDGTKYSGKQLVPGSGKKQSLNVPRPQEKVR
jgi:hypothetical protein